jgi:hypothetical protein
MDEFLATAFGFPTIVYTLLTFASLIYWLIGIAGLANMDFGGDGAIEAAGGKLDGAIEAAGGKLDGAIEAAGGKLDGAIEAAGGKLDGAIEAAGGKIDGAADTDLDADSVGGFLGTLMSLLSALRLRHAPITITASVLFLFAWVFSYLGARFLAPLVPGPDLLGELAVLVAALVPAVPITSVLTKPIGKVFVQNPGRTKRHLLGHTGKVRISASAGENAQVRIRVGGDDLLLRVRAETELPKDAEVLLVDYDEENDTYLAEPMKSLLDDEGEKKRRA